MKVLAQILVPFIIVYLVGFVFTGQWDLTKWSDDQRFTAGVNLIILYVVEVL